MNGASTNQLLPAFARVVLTRGASKFTVEDILAHAWFLGELRTPWTELLNELACAESALSLDLAPDTETLVSMSEEFRYNRDLLTVEETEGWLLARDLTEDDFNAYLVRRYWQNHPPESASPAPDHSEYVEAWAELRELLRVDLFFSGQFDNLARAVSWRLATAVELDKNEIAPEATEQERARFLERTGLDEAGVAEALKQLNRTQTWLEDCLELEVGFRKKHDSLLSDQARARTLTAMRLPLTRLKIQTLVLRSLEAAQEAVLCLTKDRLSPEQVAQECGVGWDEQQLFLGDLAPEVQQGFLSAAPGEVFAPEAGEEEFAVTRLVSKAEPSLADEAVRDRIDEQLLDAHFSGLSAKHLRWVTGGPARE